MSKKIVNIEISNELEFAKLRSNYGNMAEGYIGDLANKKLAEILNSANTEEIYDIKGTKYYVSQNGDDANDGLSPEKAIKSLDRIDSLELKFGDAVLFERGSVFRFARVLMAKEGVIYGSYSEGMKPAIYGSPENYALSCEWSSVKPNIWQLPFPYKRASGIVLDYGMIIGIQKADIDSLKENGDYYHDFENGVFYLYCDNGNPKDTYQSVEIMPAFNLITIKDYGDVIVDNLCLKYCGGFAISALDTKPNITVTNCEIGFIGGLWFNENLRFGNAIEFWAGLPNVRIENIKVNNCWFYQVYDTALSWQGNQQDTVWKNIDFSGNLFEYNNADIEFWCVDGCRLEEFKMNNNIMRFTSMGWGTRTNDGGIRGIEGCVRGITGTKNSQLKTFEAEYIDNYMDCPARQIISWNIRPEYKEKIIARGSKIFVKSEYRTLDACLQGLQEDLETEPYDFRIPAKNKQELEEIFTRFEDGAEIHWDE